jgi:hypothetical protein
MEKKFRIKWKKYLYIFFLVVLFPFVLCLYWLNYLLKVTHIRIESKKIPKEFDGFTIAHISDLHNAKFGKCEERLLQALRAETPDLIAVTGDIIDANRTNVNRAMEFVEGAVKIAPVYYVTGNHEAKTDDFEFLRQRMKAAGVRFLDDGMTEIRRGESAITLLGLKEYKFFLRGRPKKEIRAALGEKLKGMTSGRVGFKILLSHRPELFELYAAAGIDLSLCGHAHGGQIRIPFGVIAPNQGLFPKYTSGVYRMGDSQMEVSRGLGNSAFPLRFNNTPEIVIVKLTRQE